MKGIGGSTIKKELDSLTKVYTLCFDVRDKTEVEKALNSLPNDFKTIDILINNAGVLINKPFIDTSFEDFEKIYSVNVFGLASLTRLLLPIIAPKGHVVNISSMGGIGGSSKFAASATRWPLRPTASLNSAASCILPPPLCFQTRPLLFSLLFLKTH